MSCKTGSSITCINRLISTSFFVKFSQIFKQKYWALNSESNTAIATLDKKFWSSSKSSSNTSFRTILLTLFPIFGFIATFMDSHALALETPTYVIPCENTLYVKSSSTKSMTVMIRARQNVYSSKKCTYILEKILGVIYETHDSNGNMRAIKVAREEYIRNEVAILKSLAGSSLNYVCKLIDYGRISSEESSSGTAFYVMEILDCTLAKLHSNAISAKRRGGRVRSSDILRAGVQLIKALKELHLHGILHKDVTPSNIMWSCERSQFYLIDFNLSAFFLDAFGRPISKGYESCKGTSIFCSLASHRNETQCPRDDLESLFYVIVLLYKRKLPWSYCDRDDRNEIMQEKIHARNDKVFYKGMPKFMKKWLAQIDALDYGDMPNYDAMIYLFLREFERNPLLYYETSCWVL